MSSRNGGVQGFDNGPKVRFGPASTRTEDWVALNVGRCKGSGAGMRSAWQTHDRLAAG
jgi:hypothetical protein